MQAPVPPSAAPVPIRSGRRAKRERAATLHERAAQIADAIGDSIRAARFREAAESLRGTQARAL